MTLPKPNSTALSLVLLAASLPTAHAALVYVDANYGGNTMGALSSSTTDWATDPATSPNDSINDDNLWGQRTSGPGAVLFGSNGWQAWQSETAPTLITRVTGLDLNSTYTGIRLYFTGKIPEITDSKWFIDASVDGVNFTTYQDGPTANAVNTSNGGLGTSITAHATNDTRFYVDLPNVVTDASGNLDIYIRQGTGASNRTVYDGIAYDNVAVPEPSSLILVGFAGLFASLRRRR